MNSGNYNNIIGRFVTITMDRPIGSKHPKHPEIVYPINYGYIDGLLGGDGEEQDVYLLGVNEPVAVYDARIVAVIHRLDDVEDKWVAAPPDMRFSCDAIRDMTHFQEKYYTIEIYCDDTGMDMKGGN